MQYELIIDLWSVQIYIMLNHARIGMQYVVIIDLCAIILLAKERISTVFSIARALYLCHVFDSVYINCFHCLFDRAVLGSVSDYCAHHAKCPVIIVKKPHQKKANLHQQ
jgi:hypothetical protein